MRIVFRAHPAYGHVYPMMPLAEAARAAGHEVIFPIAPPFLERLRELGYRTIESGVTMVEASRRRFDGRNLQFVIDGEPNWDLYSELFAEAAVHAATDMLRQLPELGVDLIIHEDTDLAGGAVAASLGVPSVVVGTVRSFEQRIHDAFFGRPLAELRAVFGATPASRRSDSRHVPRPGSASRVPCRSPPAPDADGAVERPVVPASIVDRTPRPGRSCS